MFRQAQIKKNLKIRADILKAVRKFWHERDFLEVETPCRIPAPAPESHIDAVLSDGWFLHTSPELCMKRLLASGYERIFQICKCFRQGERGHRHLLEFTLLEWYESGIDYEKMMDQTEALIKFTAREIGMSEQLIYQGQSVDLKTKKPWKRLSVQEAFEKYSPMSLKDALENNQFDEIIGLNIEPCLKEPVFLYDYPAECGALARLKPDNPSLAERFELYICGMELCNAFTELTDPEEQRARFVQEQAFRQDHHKTIYPMPEKFLKSLYHMPQASGNALGLDRLVMLFTDASEIDKVVAFTPEEL